MKQSFRNLLVAAGAVACLAATSGTASADYLPFTINPDAINDGNFYNDVEATLISGRYVEVLSVTSPGNFTTAAIFNVDTLYTGPTGSTPLFTFESGVNNAPAQGGYRLYALFYADGSFAPNADGGFDFTGGNGYVELWADPQFDRAAIATNPTTGSGDYDPAQIGGAADMLLATGVLAPGSRGHSQASSDNGDFSLNFMNFVLTPDGDDYFVAPSPFYLNVNLQGFFDNFDPNVGSIGNESDPRAGLTVAQSCAVTPCVNQVITGNANASFSAVPEPATMTLFGLGLVGSAVARRRQQKAKKQAE